MKLFTFEHTLAEMHEHKQFSKKNMMSWKTIPLKYLPHNGKERGAAIPMFFPGNEVGMQGKIDDGVRSKRDGMSSFRIITLEVL